MAAPTEHATTQMIFGREREQERLRELLDETCAGQGRLVLISGEAGIGKTTLVRDIAAVASDRGAVILTGHCYDLTTTPPYGPWTEIIRQSPRVEGLSSLSDILAGRVDEETASLERQERLFAWATELFTSIAELQPLVVVLEDLHWSDEASLESLRRFARILGSLPMLIIATYRSDEIARRHPVYRLLPTLVRESSPERIDLRPLDEEAVEYWVESRYRFDLPEQRRLTDYLQLHAEGNPFFASEILRTLEDDDILQLNGERWMLGSLDNAGIPMLLRQVIEARLSRLTTETRDLLSIAAIAGHDVSFSLWGDVTETQYEGIAVAVEEAASQRLIESNSDGESMQFTHALIRESLYEDVLPLHRRTWHRKVSDVLIAGDNPDPDQVASHLQQAGDPRAAEWLIKAGDRAFYESYATQIAAERFESALSLLGEDESRLEERAWLLIKLGMRWYWSQPDRAIAYLEEALNVARQMDDRTLEAVALWNVGLVGTFSRAHRLRDMAEAIQIVETLTDADRARIDHHLQGEHYRPEYLNAVLSMWTGASGRYETAIEIAETGLAILSENHPLHAAICGYLYSGMALGESGLGRIDNARPAFQKSIDYFLSINYQYHADIMLIYEFTEVVLPVYPDELAERSRMAAEIDRFTKTLMTGMTGDPSVIGLFPLMFIEGRWDDIRRVMRSAIRRPISLLFRATAHDTVATVAYHTGYTDLAWDYINLILSGTENTRPEDVARWYYQGLKLQRLAAELSLDNGNFEQTRRWLEAHDEWFDWSGQVIGRAASKLLWAKYNLVQNDLAGAREIALEALEMANKPRQPLVQLEIHRFLGELDIEIGNFDDAEEQFVTAVRIANACTAPFELALTLLGRSELAIATGDLDRATLLLDEAVEILEPLKAQPALERVVNLRSRIDDARAIGLLSARETQVLELVAEGLTDRQIAEQLFISPRTVGQHTRSIFNKLGVNSRTTAALEGSRRGLI